MKTAHSTPRRGDTVADFGSQWTRYPQELGVLDSDEYFADVLGPLMTLEDVYGREVADLGAGNGRFTAVLARRASRVMSVEPSEAMVNNSARNSRCENVEFVRRRIEDLQLENALDLVFCIGVLHHVPDMPAALGAMHRALRPRGRVVLWLYGREGNGLYLAFASALRLLTVRLPDAVVEATSRALVPPLKGYRALCRRIPALPMADYVTRVLGRCDDLALRLNIFDQLNPRTARYLRRQEIAALLKAAGFVEPRFHHRHGYSWTVVATRP